MEARRELPVLILTYAGQNIWVPKPETYEVCRTFSLLDDSNSGFQGLETRR